tara:strand:+ start:1019799 stop:1021730 length:1932 start_codon:yes stop_codon:yes gene_type:complete
MSRRKKILFSAIMTITFFCVMEWSLTLIGIAAVTDTDDPYVGFSNQQPLMRQVTMDTGESYYQTATNKLDWFNDQSFPATKSANTRRVFCVGGSTTYGRPYWDGTSFVGWLRELFPLVQPDVQWEVINAGGVSYASYRVAAVMQELAEHEPDLFVVYCGQNEFLERRTYRDIFDQPALRTNLHAALMRTRTWAFADRLFGKVNDAPQTESPITLPGEVDEMLNHTVGPVDYHRDDVWQADVVRHYTANLHRMVAIAETAGAKIVFVTPASNEMDCSPFKSEPHADSHRVADFQYEQGKKAFDAGQFSSALDRFRAAVNEDVCPLRAIDPIVDAVAAVAKQHRVPLVDFPALLRQQCLIEHGHECLGNQYFLDHVHPDNETHRRLALWILNELQEQSMVAGTRPTASQIDEVGTLIESRIDWRASGVALRNLAKVLHWAGKFSEALPRAKDAIEILPNDTASLLVLADCLTQTGQYDAAVTQYERLFTVSPEHVEGYLPYGELLLWQGEAAKARSFLVLAAASRPENARVAYYLGLAENELGHHELALQSLFRSLELAPDQTGTMSLIASIYADQGDWDSAANWFETTIDADPDDSDSRFRLGMLRLKQAQFEAAMEQFQSVLRLEPSHVGARTNLAIVKQLSE